MALAFDNFKNLSGTGTSLTFSHTVTGANPIIFVGVGLGNGGDLISAVTYGGVAMTQVAKKLTITGYGVSAGDIYLYYLIAPATGANDVLITTSGSTPITGYSISYTGAKQTGQPDASGTQGPTATPSTTSVTSNLPDCWSILIAASSSTALTASTGSTLRSTSTSFSLFDSNGSLGTAGSESMTVAATGSNITTIMATIAPYIGDYAMTTTAASFTLTSNDSTLTRINFFNQAKPVTSIANTSRP